MVYIYLTVDLETHRGLYDDEMIYIGEFETLIDAIEHIDNDLLIYCNVYKEKQ